MLSRNAHPHDFVPRRLSGLWFHGVVVTDPELLAVVCSRGRDVGLDKASLIYLPINQVIGLGTGFAWQLCPALLAGVE